MMAPAPLLPVSPVPQSYRWKSMRKSVHSDAISGKRLTRKRGGQWWEVTIIFPPLPRDVFAPIVTFLNARDKDDIFYVEVPATTKTAGAVSGNMINFDNDTKLYEVVSTGPLVTTPGEILGGGIAGGTPAYLKCSKRRDVQEVKLDDDGFVRLEIDLRERI
jgi:hypothetical protein